MHEQITIAYDNTIAVMSAVSSRGGTVKIETKNAKNILSTTLNEVFDVFFATIDGALPPMIQIEEENGDFWDQLEMADPWN